MSRLHLRRRRAAARARAAQHAAARAILLAFSSGLGEHLSADEVHARASRELPDLGRGTVYATLAEFTEAGLLAAFGTSEPVRYETNTEPHDHFRCRLCLRLFDLDTLKAAEQSMPRGLHARAHRDARRGHLRRLRGLPARPAQGGDADRRQPAPCRIRCRRASRAAWRRAARAAAAGRERRRASLRLAFDDHGDAERAARPGRGQARQPRRSRAPRSGGPTSSRATCTADASDIRCPLDWNGLAARDREGAGGHAGDPLRRASLLLGARQRATAPTTSA